MLADALDADRVNVSAGKIRDLCVCVLNEFLPFNARQSDPFSGMFDKDILSSLRPARLKRKPPTVFGQVWVARRYVSHLSINSSTRSIMQVSLLIVVSSMPSMSRHIVAAWQPFFFDPL
jgi:hypothetical protein